VHRFRVWAPHTRQVEVDVRGARIALAREDDGWFSGDVDLAQAGDDYAYVLDGGAPRPDPRSSWQPTGVHGQSRLVDHDAFPWRDAGWRGAPLAAAVLYELHVGTFTPEGTFAAAITRLPHLVALGVTAVELMPVAEFPGRHGWGYDGVDLWAPHHAYGGPDGLKRLVDACHGHGLAVVLDCVYNHLGPDGNYLCEFGPYFTDRYRTPWGDALNLDGPDSDPVREFLIDNALGWLRDYHVDGLRLDAVHAIVDTSAVHLLEELATRVRALEAELGRTLWLVAESDLNDPRLVRDAAGGGYGLDAQWSDDFHHALHTVLTGERTGYYADFGSLEMLARALTRVFVYDGRHSRFRRRRHGRPATGIPGSRFIGFLQNHDQVGNRAAGERMSQLVSVARQKIGAALVLGAPFVPLLFAGEEWGATTPFQYFTDHSDPVLGQAVSAGRRREFAEFGWDPATVPDPQAEETFLRSKLRWEELQREPHAGMLAWYREMIRLRREIPALRDAQLERTHVRQNDAGWLVLERGEVTIACNFAGATARIPRRAAAPSRPLAASTEGASVNTDAIVLPPESVLVFV
jgi:maltooligosyltrehalose trehalohydrolase